MMSKKILIILLLPIWAFAQNDTIKSNKENWTESDFSFKKERIKQRPTLEKKDNIIKTSILHYLLGEVNLSFEKKISNRTSFRIGIAKGGLLYLPDFDSFLLSSELRVYLGWKKANRGFYIAPNINRRQLKTILKVYSEKEVQVDPDGIPNNGDEFWNYTQEIISNDAVIITHGAGLLFGNQWITNSFVYDLNIGVIVYEGSPFRNDYTNDGRALALSHLGFSVGYAF